MEAAVALVDEDGFLILEDDAPNEEVMKEVRGLADAKRTKIQTFKCV